MDKFKEIRPIVLGIAKRENKLLVGEGIDKVKNNIFYRCLGGGIEFLEKSEEALKRELNEEINANIKVKRFLGLEENIFVYNGKNAHEIILFYDIEIDEKDYKDEYFIVDGGSETIAKWIHIEEFKKGRKIIYPEGIFKYI